MRQGGFGARVALWDARAESVEGWLVAGLLGLGALWRLMWVLSGDRLAPLRSEARNVAIAFAHTGIVAGAYGPGLGPTAHVSPIIPVLAGLTYRVLGDTPRAELVLVLLAIVLALISFFFAYRAFRLLGLSTTWRLLALAAVCLIPFNAMIELRQLRLFEGLLAAAMSSGILLWVLTLSEKEEIGLRELTPLAAVVAVLAFTNQASALGAYGAVGILVLRRTGWRQWPAIGLLFAAMLAAVLLPWAARNEQMLGHPVLTRSNFGLELDQAYYPGAVHPTNARDEFQARHKQIHPFASDAARERVRQIGEVEYAAELAQESEAWIAAHPGGALVIAVRNFREYWFPEPWLWSAFGHEMRLEYWGKSIFVWVTTVFAFAALGLGMRRRIDAWIYVPPALLLPSLPYILTQPVLRYHYLISTMLIFLAVEFLRWLAERLDQETAPVEALASASKA